MVRRAAELTVGMGLLLGPLVYALTLQPEVETEVVVIQEPASFALADDVETVVPVVEPTVEVTPTPIVETAEPAEPADLEGRIAFAFVGEAGLVLSTEAETSWGTGRLRRHAGPGRFRAAKRADGRAVPESLWAQRGRTFDLYGTHGKLCTVRLGELSVLAQHDGPDEYYVFHPDEDGDWDEFDQNPPTAAQVRAKVWSLAEGGSEWVDATPWLVAEIIGDPSCEGAVWARDSELPAPTLLHPSDEPSPLTERRVAQLQASEELAQTRTEYQEFLAELDEESREYYGSWEQLTTQHPATVRTWLDDADQPRFLETHFGTSEGGCGEGHYSEISAFDIVTDGTDFEPIERSIEPIAIFDADLDGKFEFLYRNDEESSSGTLRSETLEHSWMVDAVFICPC